MRLSRFPARVVLPLAAVCWGCQGGRSAADGATVTDSAGVVLVASPGEDRALPWRIAEGRRIGGEDSGWAGFSFASKNVVATDGRGLIYVLDTEAYRVVVFDTAGAPLRTMGQKGGGPGELQFPGILWVTPEGVVEVADYAKQALVRFGPEGDVLPQLSLRGTFPEGHVYRLGMDTAAMILGHTDEAGRTLRAILQAGVDTLVLASLLAPTPGMVDLGCMALNMPRLFTPELRLAGRGAVVAVTAQVPYRIDLFERGRLTSSIRRAILPVAPELRAVERSYPEGMRMVSRRGRCVAPPGDLYEKFGVAEHLPQIADLAIAPDGSLWVARFTFKDEPARVDVFDAEGRYRGTLSGHGVPLGFSGDLVLFAVENQDTGGSQIGIFRITR